MNEPQSRTANRFLLLQIRDEKDPMRQHEIDCFCSTLNCDPSNMAVHDLINHQPETKLLESVDAVLIGGSGDYSVAEGGSWLPSAMESFRFLYETSKPTFASCWGFQAFARALGGRVVTDLNRAELGSIEMNLTEAGRADPVFGPLGSTFFGQSGHQDIVDELPEHAVLLASSDRVENEAFTFPGKPIYATQFHPELALADLLMRLDAYPKYLKKITGLSIDEFHSRCRETPETSRLLQRFDSIL